MSHVSNSKSSSQKLRDLQEHHPCRDRPRVRVRVYDDTGDERIEKPVGDLSGSETALLTYAFAAAAARLIPRNQTLDKLLTTIPEFDEVEGTSRWLWTPIRQPRPGNTSAVLWIC